MADPLPSRAGRHYGMDWLRIGAFQLLILYHCGMAFVGWPFAIKLMTPPPDWGVIPMFLTNPWRLSLLFLVSGYASAAMLARGRGPAAFARARIARLVPPLLLGMVLLVAPQPWIELATQHGYARGFGWFYVHDYFGFRELRGVKVPTWMHLWFVAYLLAYSLVLTGLLALPARVRRGAARGAGRLLAGRLLLPLPIAWLFAARGLLPPGQEDTHALVDDWAAHASYLPAFLVGALLHRSEPLRAAIVARWPAGLAVALAGYAFLVGCEIAYPDRTPVPDWVWPVHGLARAAECWGAIVALVGVADRHLDRDHRWRPMLTEAVFPFYLIHQTIILIVGYWLLATPMGPLARFAILVVATFAGCWAFYLAGRGIGPLRPLIGLGPRRPGRAAA